jgi:pyridoxal phosphate enzyme (YggS family)
MSIGASIDKILAEIPAHVKLIAVSKTQSKEIIMEAYNCGQRAFGENYVQELREKQPQLPGDIEWHFIGHLQRNKVKYIAPFVSWIHGVDSVRLLQEIDKEAIKYHRKISCLLQIHLGEEKSKHGFLPAEINDAAESLLHLSLDGVTLSGVMGMGSLSDDPAITASEFSELAKIFLHLKSKYFREQAHFKEISMGMSGDYRIAMANGSTMIRIGSHIFGNRS